MSASGTSPPKPPATAGSLAGAAYRLLVTTSAGHVQQVAKLAADVASFAALGEDSRLPEAVETLQAGVDAMRLGAADPQTGWLARASGKDRDARGNVAAQCLQFESERDQVEAEAREVLGRWDAHAAAARRMLVEFVVEVQALERTLVTAAKLLRDMKRAMRKERTLADTGVAHLELQAMGERAEAIHARLRLYEAVPRTAHQVHRLAQDITSRRAALATVLQNDLTRHADRFHERLQRLQAVAPGPARPAAGDALELAEEGRKNLQMWLAQTSSTCIRLQHLEHQAAHTIAKLRERAAAALASTPS
ncbi:hypothetical protein FN976_13850 [Caenimonas sedimenti]|uniref:Uncharacterized protein n=1 Tax=Caenimonas sedimenti TaxID=2596921 RepID=A0A562ZQQ8_9BURK|nr:hypothetical protein [Caenimonas sedimenti]TWO70638.1 hypothetical protein FN976_13850 [Caenimonas sedimenti]